MKRIATALLFAAALAAGEAGTPLVVIENDTIWYTNGTSEQGQILERRSDGTILFKRPRVDANTVIQAAVVKSVDERRPAPVVVARRGREGLAADDFSDVLRTVRWGVEKNAKDAALKLAREALARKPGHTELAAAAIAILAERADHAAIEATALAALAVDPLWDNGYVLAFDAISAQGKTAEAQSFARRWLDRSPSAERPNLLVGQAAEAAGDLAQARTAYRRTWDMHQSESGGLGFLRVSLAVGKTAEAAAAAEAMVAANKGGAEARVWALAAALAGGDLAKAEAHANAVPADAQLPPAAQAALRHNRGVLDWRLGRRDRAIQAWTGSDDPASRMALAMARRSATGDPARQPAALRPLAVELAAAAALEKGDPVAATAGLDLAGNSRHILISQYAAVLASRGASETVRVLDRVRTPEARRYQIYGHIIAGRLGEAQSACDDMPEDDGWTAAVRVWLAAARKDEAAAAALLRKAQAANDPPKAYLAQLAAAYQGVGDEVITDRFNADGDLLPTGWNVDAPGTGIDVRIAGGRLTLAGKQVGGDPTRVWRELPAQVRQIRVPLDPARLGQAQAGVEITTLDGKAGVAVGMGADGVLQARSRDAKGAWGAWSSLGIVASSASPVVVEVDGDQYAAVDAADPAVRRPLGTVAPGRSSVQVAVWGQGADGASWSLSLPEVAIHLKAQPKRR